jgi:GNAT superfamily N-acetyltransferase
MTTACSPVQELGRDAIERWLPCLDAWLLPDAFYGVRQTWPILYRRDGHGRFFVITDGDRLLAHCATRDVVVHGENGPMPVCLLGSVATDPAHRGRGLASQVLAAALRAADEQTTATFLWAERGDLYARAGFRPGTTETCFVIARRPRANLTGVRIATIDDHAALLALHRDKPWRVDRCARAMSTLLTTPGMTTVVLERNGAVVAYACLGKGADLQDHWHELGGGDADLAILLPAAMHVAERTEAVLLLPPYRQHLPELLGGHVVDIATVDGPMVRSASSAAVPACWFDGLDSV